MSKICSKCKLELMEGDFSLAQLRDKYGICKNCKRKYDRERREYKREEISQKRKSSYPKNKFKILSRNKINVKNNVDKVKEYQRIYQVINRQKINKGKRDYYNKIIRTNPTLMLKESISRGVDAGLKRNVSSKKSKSCWEFLPYLPEELWSHLESQMINENSWMNKNNRGIYLRDKWIDNDSSTWTWQIDHIIPHSTFHYEDMECEEFQRCWALTNLRPYPAKQNVIEGVSKIRHKGTQ